MATFKTVTFTEDEWKHVVMAFFTREERLRYLIENDRGQSWHWEQQLAELEALAKRLEV
jgi:hypothetical protein